MGFSHLFGNHKSKEPSEVRVHLWAHGDLPKPRVKDTEKLHHTTGEYVERVLRYFKDIQETEIRMEKRDGNVYLHGKSYEDIEALLGEVDASYQENKERVA